MIDLNNKIFDSYPEVPVWKKVNGFLVCTDHKTGKELKRVPCHKDANGLDLKAFESYNVKIIKDFIVDKESLDRHLSDAPNESIGFDEGYEEVKVKAGYICILKMLPNGELTLSDSKIGSIGITVEPDCIEILKNENKIKIK